MATQPIDLSAGLVPAQGSSDIDLSAGLVPAQPQFAPPPGTPGVPRPQVDMQPESIPEALGGNDIQGVVNAVGNYGGQFLGRVHDNLQSVAEQATPENIVRAMDVRTPHSFANFKKNMAAVLPRASDYNTLQKAAVNIPADIATGAIFDTEGKAPEAAHAAITGAEDAVRGAAADRLTRSVRAAMPAETSALPNQAILGVEKFIEGAAPTGTNTRFRANGYVAAGDLAEIGRNVRAKLAESKGGIVQPDMRTRVIVDAINQHLQKMYQTEIAPQIANHPNAPVPVPADESTAAGIAQMVRSGDVGVAKLAVKARSGTLTLDEAYQLARGVNAELRKYEAMTPEAQAAARINTRALGGLKILDRELSDRIDDQLRVDGQPGIKEVERAYAALSAMRDQIRARMNTAELQHPGPLKSAVRAVHNLYSGMSGNIAGASQAAVADVRTGRALQQGLQHLADSGIKANRAVPRSPAPLELTPPPGRVPPATQDLLNFNGADQEPGPKAGGGNGAPKVPNSTADVQSRSGNAAGAAQENGILAQVQKEHPDWSVSQQLMEAGKRSERRAGPRNGHVFTEEERQKFLDREREVEAARHPNKWLKENPFDKDPLARELAKRETERMLKGGEDILSGRP